MMPDLSRYKNMRRVVQTNTFAFDKPLDLVIIVPAKNETARIADCLYSIQRSMQSSGRIGGVIVIANNCSDDTAIIAIDTLTRWNVPGCVLQYETDTNSVGLARRIGLETARLLVKDTGAFLSTDADCLVDVDWVADIMGHLRTTDVVCGNIALRSDEPFELSRALKNNSALETRYKTLCGYYQFLCHPQIDNPWPHHSVVGGANISTTVNAAQCIGPMRKLHSSEDRDYVDRAVAQGLRIKFADNATVYASPRLSGRAPDGMADSLAHARRDINAPIDSYCEPFRNFMHRLEYRSIFSKLSASTPESKRFSETVDLPVDIVDGLLAAQERGTAWKLLENYAPCLRRVSLRPSDLPQEIRVAENELDNLQGAVVHQGAAG